MRRFQSGGIGVALTAFALAQRLGAYESKSLAVILAVCASLALLWFAFQLVHDGIAWYRSSERAEFTRKTAGLMILLVLAVVGLSCFWSSEFQQPKHPQQTGNSDAPTSPQTAPVAVMSALPGMSLHMQIRLNHLAGNRRKYLFDFGNINNERLSIYISPDSIFTLAFLDAKGEQHPVQIPLGGDGIPLGEFFYLGCEFGIDGQSTQLLVLVDGKERGFIRLPFRVDIESLDVPGGVVGADLNGNNGGSFDLKEVIAYSKTLDGKEVQDIAQYFQGHSNVPHVEFRGKQWMRVRSVRSHDLKQLDPSAAPIFRKE